MIDYSDFIQSKSQLHPDSGFTPNWMPDFLFDFQAHLVDWAVRKGRAAIFADCGLGKTPMQLVWAENVRRETNKPVLILTPLAVSHQTIREAEKFDIECFRSTDGSHRNSITVTNYEKLHYFDPDDYGGVVCDESGILKNFNGVTRSQITEFMRRTPYRLLCTATAAPNDFIELGNSSDALGYLGFQDMLTKFFREEKKSFSFRAWGRQKYRFRGHAETPFWQWVCSWARACRRPSDLGFSDAKFELPPLIEKEHILNSLPLRHDLLFALTAENLSEQREERRLSIEDRCKCAYELASSHDSQVILWCHLNDEGDLLEAMLPNSVQVSGSMKDEEKEERFLAFYEGDIPYLITKPKIAAFGLNWQNCHRVITFTDHSYEAYYQSVRRCWRYGQKFPVTVDIIATESEGKVLANLQRKSEQASHMFDRLVEYMSEAQSINPDIPSNQIEVLPSWLG